MREGPTDWPVRRLSDLARLPSGQVNPLRSPYSEQILIAPDHVESGTGRILELRTAADQGASSGKYVVHPGDVVYSKIRPALRKAVIADFQGLCSADMYPMTPSEDIDSRYLLAILLSEGFSRFAESVSGRSGIPKINRHEFEEFTVPLPPITEQQRISEILDSADANIVATQSWIGKLESVSSALAAAQLADLAADAQTVMQLSSVATVLSGVTLGSEPSGSGTVEIPYLRVANVQDGYVDTSEMKTIRILRSDLPKYLLQKGDVLLTEGGDLDKLGRGTMWDARIPECICQNHIFRVRCDESRVLPGYLSLYIGSPMGKAYFLKIAKQTTNLASINSTQLKQMPLPIPCIRDQASLIELMASSQSILETERQRLTQLQLLKQGLMDDLLTGRLQVTVLCLGGLTDIPSVCCAIPGMSGAACIVGNATCCQTDTSLG